MKEKIARCIYSKRIGFSTSEKEWENALLFADAILSLPSDYVAGEHEITVGEALEGYEKAIQLLTEFMSQVGYTPEDEHYWLHHGAQNKIANIKEFLDALTFNGHRITKPIPSSDEAL